MGVTAGIGPSYGWVALPTNGFPERPGPQRPLNCHTIGLTAGFAHPELTVVGLDYRQSMNLLNDLGEQVRAGARLRPGTSWTDAGPVELVEVHRDHWHTDHFANWWVVTDEMGVPMETEPHALQVLASDPGSVRLDQPPEVAPQ